MSDLQKALGSIAKAATQAGSTLGGIPATVATIAGLAFSAAAAFAKAGHDPVVEIKRILSTNEPVDAVDDDWDEALGKKVFRRRPLPDAQPVLTQSVVSGQDPYDEDDGQP